MMIIGNDNANMEDFDKTGWKLLPATIFINEETHEELIDEKLFQTENRDQLLKTLVEQYPEIKELELKEEKEDDEEETNSSA